MATTSSSRRAPARRALRLVDALTGQAVEFALLAAYAPTGLDLADEGVVHESHAYEAYLLAGDEVAEGEACWCVNGEGEACVRLSREPAADGPDGLRAYRLAPGHDGPWAPFALTYGFAHVELALPDGEALATRDVACLCDREDQEASVAAMVAELVDGPDAEAMRWMLAGAPADAARDALAGGAPAADASRSLRAFLALCDEVLQGLARNQGFMCTRAYCRTVKADVCVAPSQVRQLGRRELAWLASNPDAVRPAPAAGQAGAARYEVARLRTERPQVTRDVPENRALLAFARAVADALARVVAEADARLGHLRQVRERLRALAGEGGLMPSLVVIDACLAREEPLAGRARTLLARARRCVHALERALPEVRRERWRLPRRTKPFQEIPAYAELHALMRRWDAFGAFDLARDGLVLRTWRMDKLYEYYVLYALLSALRRAGFGLDGRVDEPARRARYSLRDRDYVPEDQVATAFELARGDERLTLLYQPVLYADAREENGVRLHRTSAGQRHPYWTPDYLLVREAGGRRTTAVLDAKFRRPADVRRVSEVSVGPGFSAQTESTLRECLRKYRLETGSADGSGVDAVWLVCGRAERREVWRLQASSWSREQRGLACDGVATLAPGADAVDEVLDALGIAAAR